MSEDAALVADTSQLYIWPQYQFEQAPLNHSFAYDLQALVQYPISNEQFIVIGEQEITRSFFENGSEEGLTLSFESLIQIEAHEANFTGAVLNSNASILALTRSPDTIELWDIATQERFVTFQEHESIRDMQFNGDDMLLASGTERGINLWGVPEGCG